MQRRGYLIRFIDIGLIILFGFLMISDLTVISQIALPGNADTGETLRNDDVVMLGVTIAADGKYSVDRLVDREILYADIEAAEELEFVLKTLSDRQREDGKTISVYIEPAADAPMQNLVNVLDICERLHLPKNINTEAALAAENV